MPILTDYHLHTFYSGDSQTPMEEMIEKGISQGMETLCFTEHMDMDFPYATEEEQGRFELDIEAYRQGFARCREKYGDRIQLNFGVELGIQPHIAGKFVFAGSAFSAASFTKAAAVSAAFAGAVFFTVSVAFLALMIILPYTNRKYTS